jgi:hypothetical protein
MRKLWIFICFLGIPCSALSQTSQKSWESLSTLQPGQKVQVVEMGSKAESGTFLSFSSTAISLQESAGAQVVQRQDVRRIKLMDHSHRLRNTLIGAGVGAGVGAVIGAATNLHPCGTASPCTPILSTPESAGIVAVVGFVSGAVVGLLLPSHKTIYSAKTN